MNKILDSVSKIASLLCNFKTNGEVYIFHPLILSTNFFMKNDNMVHVKVKTKSLITCEHLTKEGLFAC